MKKTSLRLTSLFLISLILLTSCIFVSCADTGNENDQTTATPAATENIPDTLEATVEDTTPVFPEANYGGDSFVIISRSPSASSYPAHVADHTLNTKLKIH